MEKNIKGTELMLDQETLHELFEYRDGELYWKIKANTTIKIGDRAGCKDPKLGATTRIKRRLYKNNRIIFMMFNGWLPDRLDYIDCNRLNDKIENLRPATLSETCCNRRKPKSNVSGYKGVSWNTSRNKWIASISKDTKQFNLGYFDNKEEAYKVYCNAANKYHGEFANVG